MRTSIALTALGALIPVCAALAANPARYFDGVNPGTLPPQRFGTLVEDVTKGYSADIDGVKPGDLIIGIDSNRVRDLGEAAFMHYSHDDRPETTLTVIRDGALTILTARPIFPTMRAFVKVRSAGPPVSDLLKAWNVSLADIFGSPPPAFGPDAATGAIRDVLDAFDATEPVPRVQPFMAIEYLPARAQDALWALTARKNPADREWVLALLQVFARLVTEHYDEAGALIAQHHLLDRKMDPFLDRLAVFYKALIDRRISVANGLSLAPYDVDADFFAFCYPYPVTAPKAAHSFEFDPDYQALFDRATSGLAVSDDDFRGKAYGYANPGTSNDTERYIGQVKAALLDQENHGGWPFRSTVIYSEPGRSKTISQLLARLDAKPDRTVETAFALLAPSVIANNETAFRRAYTILAAAGDREAGCANDIINNTERFWSLKPEALQRARQSIEASRSLPEFYQCLRKLSPTVDRHLANGTCQRVGTFIQGASTYCHAYPVVVARAFAVPPDPEAVNRVEQVALLTGNATDIREALVVLSADLASKPRLARLTNLLDLHDRVGAGPVCEAAARVLTYLAVIGDRFEPADGVDAVQRLRTFFANVESLHYAKIARELSAIENDDPTLDGTVEDYCQEAGVPSVCLLLAAKLREAGHARQAEHYVDKAIGLYMPILQGYASPERFRMAFRDFTSVPGFEDRFLAYRQWMGNDNSVGSHVLKAVAASYRNDGDTVVREVLASAKSGGPKSSESYLYDRAVFNSAEDLRARLLHNLMAKKALTEEQVAQLKAAPKLQLDVAASPPAKP